MNQTFEDLNAQPRHDSAEPETRRSSMGKAATDWTKTSGQSPASWPLRLAQQALASALERAAICPQLDVARLRNNAREALSALSADDRGQLERWICLLWRSRHGEGLAQSGRALGLIDANLANAIGRCMPSAAQGVRHDPAGMEIAA
jgi:hypothetical protein